MAFWNRIFVSKKEKKKTDRTSLKGRFSALKYIPAFFVLIWRCSPWLTFGNLLLRLLKAGIPLAMLYLGKLIIDEVILRINGGEFIEESLWWYVGAELALAVLSELLNRLITLSDSLLGDLFANQSSVQLMEHASRMDLNQFEDAEFYDQLERARRQTLGRTVLLSQIGTQAQDIVTVIFLAAGLIAFSPELILILLVTLIPSFIGETHFNVKSYSLVRSWTPERRELDYLRYTGASDETAKEIKMFGLANFLVHRFRNLADRYYDENKKIAVSRAFWGVFLSSLATLGYYFAYVLILFKALSGAISVGDLTFLAGSFARMRSMMEGVLSRFSSISEGAMYLQDFFEFFAIQPSIVKKAKTVAFPKPILKGLVFDEVSFQYQNTQQPALEKVSFHIPPGERVALVGENGAGKTTLVKLIARLYDPSEGSIRIDGTDLRDFDPEELKKNIGVIFQDFVKYQFTAGNNIAVGQIDQLCNQDRIESAAQRGLADAVIDSLPHQYEQMIGRRFADGVDLSGGQWQKIALARAYMRDAQLLILDEPTAALDAKAEYEVFQRFVNLTQGKMTFLISHRFSTVRMADKILVFKGGRLVEEGDHESLLEKKALYAELFRLQARGYV